MKRWLQFSRERFPLLRNLTLISLFFLANGYVAFYSGYLRRATNIFGWKVEIFSLIAVLLMFLHLWLFDELRRYRSHKGFFFSAPIDPDMVENMDAAAEKKNQPLMVWFEHECNVIGINPSPGASGAFNFALQRETTRATDFVSVNPN